MPDIKIDITRIVEKYLVPIVISFVVGLGLYLTVFDKEWGWPTFIGCIVFLMIEAGVWIKQRHDLYRFIKEKDKQFYKKSQAKSQAQDEDMKKAAVLFLHNCKDDAVVLYNHPKHPGESETERFVSSDEMPGFQAATRLAEYEDDQHNQKYGFLVCDYQMNTRNGCERHIVFHPLFYKLVGKYIETGVMSF